MERWGWAFMPRICKPPHTSSPFPLTQMCCLRLSLRSHHAGTVSTDGRGTRGQERGQRSRSCRAWTTSCLQTTEVCLPQDSVDVVIGDTAAVAMETRVRGASRVFRLRAEGGLGDAVILAMYAWPGAGHYCSLWTTDPITAVTAGRLQTQRRRGLWNVVSWTDVEALNKTFWAFLGKGALHMKCRVMCMCVNGPRFFCSDHICQCLLLIL